MSKAHKSLFYVKDARGRDRRNHRLCYFHKFSFFVEGQRDYYSGSRRMGVALRFSYFLKVVMVVKRQIFALYFC